MKEGSLFCFVCIYDPPNSDASDHVLWSLGKALEEEGGVHWLGFRAFGLVV